MFAHRKIKITVEKIIQNVTTCRAQVYVYQYEIKNIKFACFIRFYMNYDIQTHIEIN